MDGNKACGLTLQAQERLTKTTLGALIGLVVASEVTGAEGGSAAERDSADLETINVVAGRTDQPPGSTAASVDQAGRGELARRQIDDLRGVLETSPGATADGGPRQVAMTPSIRGLGEGRVAVRVDGARQNLNLRHRGQTFIEPGLLEEVQVLSGPASTLYGSGAIGGVVNMRTPDAADIVSPGRNVGGRVNAGYDSNGQQRVAGLVLAQKQGSTDWTAGYVRRSAGDFEDGDGNEVPYTDVDTRAGLARGRWQFGHGHELALGYMGYEDETSSLRTADQLDGTEIERRTRQDTVTLSYNYQPDPGESGLWDLRSTFYYSDLRLDEAASGAEGSERNALDTLGLDAYNRSRWHGGEEAVWDRQELIYGIEAYRDRQVGEEDDQPRLGFADSQQDTIGGFAHYSVALMQRWELGAGARLDVIEQEAQLNGEDGVDRPDVRYEEWSSQASIAYRLTEGATAYASYAEAFRAPALRELYIGGEHFPGNRYIPNPGLRPEEARSREAGVRLQRRGQVVAGDRLTGRLSGFHTVVEDYIDQVVTDTQTRFENVSQARIQGVEIKLRYDHPRFWTQATARVLRGDDREAGDPLETIPADTLRIEAARRWHQPQLDTGFEVTVASSQDRVPGGEHGTSATPGYERFDLFVSWYSAYGVELDARLDNVGNTSYRRHGTEVPERGRNFRVSMRYHF